MQFNNLRTIAVLLVVFCSISAAKIIYVDDDAAGANDGLSWENAYVYLQDALADANSSEKPVKWEISEGGNGHVYQAVYASEGISWTEARIQAERTGGHLVTITSEDENLFVFSLVDQSIFWEHHTYDQYEYLIGPWLGGYQLEDSVEPDGGWTWLTGEPFVYQNWDLTSPFPGTQEPSNDYNGGLYEDVLKYCTWGNVRRPTWHDWHHSYLCPGYIIEYPKIIYVDDDATGANDGTSWKNAYVYLQEALGDANSSEKPVEIRVAKGTYKPNEGIVTIPEFDWRTLSFQLINGVTLKGGYAGASDPNARDIEQYETILSGDLNGDDVEVVSDEDLCNDPNRVENSYHVLIASGTDMTAVLDGFVITSGYADGPELEGDPFDVYRLRSGGGMYNWEGNPTLANCTFSGNRADVGGGMFNQEGSPILSNCAFSRNSAVGGGGISNQEGSPILTNCTFIDNGAFLGGGMFNDKGSSTLTNCTFSGNSNSGMISQESSVTLTNCTFSRKNDGGMYNKESSVTLTNCIFSGNRFCGMWIKESSVILANCTFSGNDGDAIIDDCYEETCDSTLILTNCILWNNIPNKIPQFSTVTYSNVQGGWEGEGNIDEDPLFANPGYWADVNDLNISVEPNDPNAVWVDGDYHLKSEAGRWNPNTQTWAVDDVTSPCVDAGDPNMPVGDEPFPSGIRINMGAYGGTTEASKSFSGIPEVVNVNDSGNGSQVTLIQGQILAVTLESNPSTGYGWDRIEKEDSIFEKFGDTLYFPSEQDDGTVGAGGWEILYFRAVSAGQETLELVYRRSWETDVEPAKTFSIDVVVN